MPVEAAKLARSLGGLAVIWSWWTSELSATFPRAHGWLNNERDSVVLYLGRASTEVTGAAGPHGESQEQASWPRAIWDLELAETDRLAALCAGRRVSLQLDSSLVLRIATRVPSAGGTTREAVGYALLQDSPLLPEHMVFDWRLAAADRAGDDGAWSSVDVAICDAAVLARIDRALSGCGTSGGAITAAEPSDSRARRFRFKRLAGRTSGHSAVHVRAGLLISMLVLMIAAPLGVGLLATVQADQARSQLELLERQHAAEEPLLRRMAATRTLRDALAPHLGKAGALATIEDVAYRLGDQSWLDELVLDAGQLRLGGRSADPGRAARELATSPGLLDVQLEAVNAAAPVDGNAAFRIVARVRGDS